MPANSADQRVHGGEGILLHGKLLGSNVQGTRAAQQWEALVPVWCICVRGGVGGGVGGRCGRGVRLRRGWEHPLSTCEDLSLGGARGARPGDRERE